MIIEGNGFHYALENRLIKKLDIMIKRCEQDHPKKDAELLIEGGEGEGKTNSAVAVGYYIKKQTEREIHLYFRLEPMIKFAQTTKRKVIIWDEPALDALSTDWYKKANIDLIRLLMAIRKNRHFFIFNLTKFHKFREYIVVDRALGMIHMYSRNEIEPGRFVYIRKHSLEDLYNIYRTKKKRLYKKFIAFRGNFPEVLEKHFDKMGIFVEGKPNATYQDYENEKTKAILSIGNDKPVSKYQTEIEDERNQLAQIIKNHGLIHEAVVKIGKSERSIFRWAEQSKKLTKKDGDV